MGRAGRQRHGQRRQRCTGGVGGECECLCVWGGGGLFEVDSIVVGWASEGGKGVDIDGVGMKT